MILNSYRGTPNITGGYVLVSLHLSGANSNKISYLVRLKMFWHVRKLLMNIGHPEMHSDI